MTAYRNAVRIFTTNLFSLRLSLLKSVLLLILEFHFVRVS